MSFDLSTIPNKGDLITPPAPTPPAPTPSTTVYALKKSRLQTRLTRRLQNTTSLPVQIRVGFLTDEDKTELGSGLEAMGYTCTLNENGNSVTIS